jgi:DNA-directed RNA polymerase specialized sigma24 family protein
MNRSSVRQLNTAGISHRCAKEQRHFLNGMPFDPAYCYELFHRALNQSDDGAWQNLLEIFSPLVSGWILRHRDFSQTHEDVEYFVQGAFVRFWTALSGRGFDEGRDLAALLLYLKRCVHSEIVDHLRRDRLQTLAAATEELQEVPDSIQVQTDPIAVENLWALVEDRLIDEKERIVVYASFFLAFQPREIFAHYRSHFSGVREVYRIKENVISRLKRTPQLEDFVSIDG